MAINKEKKVTAEEGKVIYQYVVKVLKVSPRKGKPRCYRFNAEVNGITIYGMDYVTYTDRSGKERDFIAFPQYKSSTGEDKYYNHVYFPVNDPDYRAVYEDIERQIESLL